MKIKSIELLRTSQTWDGTALPDYPAARPELRATRMIFPIGAKTGWHHHTVINYGIVEQGDLTIVCQDGTERTFHQGEAIVEVVGTIHRGENRGAKPVILNMFYVSAPGIEVTIQHPELDVLLQDQEKKLIQELPKPIDKATARIQKLLLVIGEQTLPRRQIIADLGLKQRSRKSLMENYLWPAHDLGYVEFAIPSMPHIPDQAYKLTAKGLEVYHSLLPHLQ